MNFTEPSVQPSNRENSVDLLSIHEQHTLEGCPYTYHISAVTRLHPQIRIEVRARVAVSDISGVSHLLHGGHARDLLEGCPTGPLVDRCGQVEVEFVGLVVHVHARELLDLVELRAELQQLRSSHLHPARQLAVLLRLFLER